MSGDWRTAWVNALDELELDVTATEALLDNAHRAADAPRTDPWRPPNGLGPLPVELRPRADAILTRQLAAAEEITRRLVGNRRQAAMVGRIETGESAPKRPAYLDCAM